MFEGTRIAKDEFDMYQTIRKRLVVPATSSRNKATRTFPFESRRINVLHDRRRWHAPRKQQIHHKCMYVLP
jgi:hypothetical protein